MNIIFIVVSRFPYGEASSIRALNICHLLHDAGHIVHVISDYPSNPESNCNFCTYEAVSQYTISICKRHNVVKKSIEALKKYCDRNKIDAVLTNARFDRFDKVSDFCHENGLKLYVENCEWYHYSNFKLGILDYRYWKNQWMITKGFKRADAFISISRLLDEHNSSLGIPSIRIPTIMDTEEIPYDVERAFDKNKITIAYTGNPGKSKEFLFPIISALAEDDVLKSKIQFHIYGPNKNQVMMNISHDSTTLSKAGDSVVIHGRVSQTSISEVVRNSDYLIFLRPDRLSSNAGFPTKLGESMAVGTPVITNNTGDIGLYLKDGVNGFFLEDYKSETVKKMLHNVLNVSQGTYVNMRKMARKTAEDNFEYRNYIDTIKQLLQD